MRAAAQRRQVPSPGSLPGEAKRGEKTSKGSVVSSHGERSVDAAPLTASPSTSSSSSPPPQVPVQSAPRPKGAPKVKSFPKMGHLPNVTPSPRVQQPKSRSQGSNMPTVEEDIFGSWDEIERKERQIRMELNAAAPGDPILHFRCFRHVLVEFII